MSHIYYIIFLSIIVVMMGLIYNEVTNLHEKFIDVKEVQNDDKQKPLHEYTPGIIKPPDDQDGNIYKGLQKYETTLIDNEIVEEGIYKCLKDCQGNCVEFGYTGTAYCFPGYA